MIKQKKFFIKIQKVPQVKLKAELAKSHSRNKINNLYKKKLLKKNISRKEKFLKIMDMDRIRYIKLINKIKCLIILKKRYYY